MPNHSRVIGIIHAKNEWPLLGISIQYALNTHCDEVIVLDHNSSDGTSSGLAMMQGFWGERLKCFRTEDSTFYQDAIYEILVSSAKPNLGDWIYTFDADEFLVTNSHSSLKALISELDSDVDVISTQVSNFVSHKNFQVNNIAHYFSLVHQSIPNVFMSVNGETQIEDISSGRTNYFDYPFSSKVIAKYSKNLKFAPGSHSLRFPISYNEEFVEPASAYRAHLPMLSKSRFGLRQEQSKALTAAGFPVSFGWQSRLVQAVLDSGDVDDFWEAHSINDAISVHYKEISDQRALPHTVKTTSLIEKLRPTLDQLSEPPFPLNEFLAPSKNVFGEQMLPSLPAMRLIHERLELEISYANLNEELESLRLENSEILTSRTWKIASMLKRLIF